MSNIINLPSAPRNVAGSSVTTLTLDEAAAMLNMSAEGLRLKAVAGKVPGVKPGKRWVFIEEDLVEFIRGGYDSSRQASRKVIGNVCHFSSEAISGGMPSPQRDKENAFVEALAQAKKSKPRSS